MAAGGNGNGNANGNGKKVTAVADVASVQEDLSVTATGNLLSNDLGNNISVSTPGTYNGTYGKLVLNSDGNFSYTLFNSSAAVQGLAANQTVTDVFSYSIGNKGNGVSSSSTLTVTVTGTDDQPVITSAAQAASITEAANTTGSATADTASGAVTFTDVDLKDAHSASFSANGNNYLGTFSLDPISQDSTGGKTGAVNWHFSVADNQLDFLAAGQQLTQSYNVTVDDGHGGTAMQTVTVTITGTDDQPVITSAAQVASITEAANTTGSATADTASGAVTFTDVDLKDAHSASFSTNGNNYLGTFSLDPISQDSTGGKTGAVNWHFSVADNQLDFLAAGQQLTQSYNVTVDDGHGGTAMQTVTVTITGTDDQPVITSAAQAASITEAVDNSPDEVNNVTHQAAGSISFNDPDLIDTHTADQAFTGAVWHKADGTTAVLSGNLGSLALAPVDDTNKNVDWTYSVQDHALDFLAQGESVTLTYNITIDDHHGGTATTPVTITLNGTNDAPIITSLPGDSAGASWQVNGHPLTATGTATVIDPDVTDTVHVSIPVTPVDHGVRAFLVSSGTFVDLNTALTPGGGLQDTDLAKYGLNKAELLSDFSFHPTGNPTGTDYVHDGTQGTLTWNFNSGNETFQSLSAGERLGIYYYAVSPDDGHHSPEIGDGGTIFYIDGVNAGPALDVQNSQITGNILEQSGVTASSTADSASGSISFADVNIDDAHSASFSTNGNNYLGTFSLDPISQDSTGGKTGAVNWHFSVADNQLDFLAAGQQLTQSYNVTVDDGHGGTAMQTVTVTITGTDDQPVITSAAQVASITEAANTTGSATADTASGAVTFTDVDLKDAHSASFSTNGNNYLGTFSLDPISQDSTGGKTGAVNWNFSVADNQLDFLAAGQQLTQSYNVTVDDGHGGTAMQTVTVTITGTDDQPVITSAAQVASITEAANTTGSATADTASGAVTFTDVDLKDAHSASFSTNGNNYLGTFSLDPISQDSTGGKTGAVNWHFSVADNQLDFLAAGQQLTQSYNVTVDDGHGGTAMQTVTVTITGTDDQPVITSAAQAASITEAVDNSPDEVNNVTHQAAGSISFNDPDLIDTHTADQAFTGAVWHKADGTTAVLSGNLGSLALAPVDDTNKNFGWTYSVQDHALDFLAQGESVTLTYNITIDDHHGGTATTPVTITLNGTNDAPVITSDAQAVVPSATGNAQSADGAITFNDADFSDVHSATFTSAGNGYLGTFSLDPITQDSTGGHSGTVNWHFSADDAALATLTAGQSVVQTYELTVSDEHGGIATKDVAITLTGVDHAPTISATVPGQLVEAGYLQAGVSSASSQITHDDVDGHAFYILDGWTLLSGTTFEKDGTYGSAFLNTVSNTLTYNLDNTKPATNSLYAGEHANDSFIIPVGETDGNLLNATTVTFNITGTDDAPVASSESFSLSASGVVSGSLSHDINDPDAGDLAHPTSAQSLLTGANAANIGASGQTTIQGLYGQLTIDGAGNYSYAANANSALNLATGTQAVDKFQYVAQDLSGAPSNAAELDFVVTGTPHDHIVDFESFNKISTDNTIDVSPFDDAQFQGAGITQWEQNGMKVTVVSGSPDPVFDFRSDVHGTALYLTQNQIAYEFTRVDGGAFSVKSVWINGLPNPPGANDFLDGYDATDVNIVAAPNMFAAAAAGAYGTVADPAGGLNMTDLEGAGLQNIYRLHVTVQAGNEGGIGFDNWHFGF